MTLCDAHNHLHDVRLASRHGEIFSKLAELNVTSAVVNGTQEADWPAVAALARQQPWVKPAFGLHPWHVPHRSPNWQQALLGELDAHPHASIGEIGLDRWISGHDLPDQSAVFSSQLTIATARNLPATIHCIQAWGALWEIVRQHPLPECGFLLHAFGGPLEMVKAFVERGAYFSFPAYFLHERKAAQRAVFAALPLERLLVETDAPDLRPPDQRNPHPLCASTGEALNHPANLEVAYAGLAEIRGLEVSQLADVVSANYARLFGV